MEGVFTTRCLVALGHDFRRIDLFLAFRGEDNALAVTDNNALRLFLLLLADNLGDVKVHNW